MKTITRYAVIKLAIKYDETDPELIEDFHAQDYVEEVSFDDWIGEEVGVCADYKIECGEEHTRKAIKVVNTEWLEVTDRPPERRAT